MSSTGCKVQIDAFQIRLMETDQLWKSGVDADLRTRGLFDDGTFDSIWRHCWNERTCEQEAYSKWEINFPEQLMIAAMYLRVVVRDLYPLNWFIGETWIAD